MTEQITGDHLESARFEGLSRKLRFTSRRGKRNEKVILGHIESCERLHKRVFTVCLVILAWVVGHSPESAVAFAKIAKILFP